MKTKKTITIPNVVTIANRILSKSTCESSIRTGVSVLLCQILEETNNYNGFSYLREGGVPEGAEPGIIFDTSPEHNHKYPDDTRRQYFCKSKY